ncbi:hypothetical protein GCM10009122_03570 [Fulvivirga kasyanovii]|uniref:Uncharacterized protein n=1 Tax=Fulvivirga kasyanovii TaxID=396812 RepID=A0ABW9RV72_9BACT|nr:hypothetical protein [Fulvivirga kasyanovii]MTI26880.1 hypothetical protein [Fulvivirga kasyanovii]
MDSQNFYFLEGEGVHPIAQIESPDIGLSPYPWTNGRKIDIKIEEPIVYDMDMSDLDNSEEDLEDMDLRGYKPNDFNIPTLWTYLHPPLISKKLADVITSFPNVKLELFKAEVHNPMSGTVHKDYYAFNLLQIAEFEVARELKKDIRQRSIRIPSIEYPIFYLYDDGPLVVNESVKNAIINEGIEGLYFELTSQY